MTKLEVKLEEICQHHSWYYEIGWLESIKRFFSPLKVCKKCGEMYDE